MAEILSIKEMLKAAIDKDGNTRPDGWMDLDQLRAYHPDHPSRSTVYEREAYIFREVYKKGKFTHRHHFVSASQMI